MGSDSQRVRKSKPKENCVFMRRIQLNRYITPNKKAVYLKDRNYCVFLDFGRRVSFSNKKEMLKFLAAARLELKSARCEIIMISKTLYSSAADAFLLYGNLGLDCFDYLLAVYRLLSIASNSHGENSNTITMVNMYKCLGSLQVVVDRIAELHRARNLYLDIQQLRVVSENLRQIQRRLDSIGATGPGRP